MTKFKVFRVKKEHRHDYGFLSIEQNQRFHGFDFKLDLYEPIYEGEIEFQKNNIATLETIFTMLNINHPQDWLEKKLYSMSVGDIVVLDGNENRVYYCDSCGWEKINI